MSEHDDRKFIKHFGLLILGLVIFTILIMLLALVIHRQLVLSENPARELAKQERVQPVFGVYAGEAGHADAVAAVEAAAPATATSAAFDGSLDGELIYEQVCKVCHETGVAGAPLMQRAEWSGRLEQGNDMLVANAINGIGAMPPRGGRPDLSDEQVEISVKYMIEVID